MQVITKHCIFLHIVNLQGQNAYFLSVAKQRQKVAKPKKLLLFCCCWPASKSRSNERWSSCKVNKPFNTVYFICTKKYYGQWLALLLERVNKRLFVAIRRAVAGKVLWHYNFNPPRSLTSLNNYGTFPWHLCNETNSISVVAWMMTTSLECFVCVRKTSWESKWASLVYSDSVYLT